MEEYLKPKFENLEIHKIISEYTFDDGMHKLFIKKLSAFKSTYDKIKNQEVVEKWEKELSDLFFELHNIEEDNAEPITDKTIEDVVTIPQPVSEEKTIEKTPEDVIFEDLMDRTKRGGATIMVFELKEYKHKTIDNSIKNMPDEFILTFREQGFKFIFTRTKNLYIITKKQL